MESFSSHGGLPSSLHLLESYEKQSFMFVQEFVSLERPYKCTLESQSGVWVWALCSSSCVTLAMFSISVNVIFSTQLWLWKLNKITYDQ